MVFNPKFGAFNKQIIFSTITKVDDGFGGFTATFAPYATVWAYVKPLSMNEQLVRGQEAGTTTYDVWVQSTGDYNFTRQMKVTYNGKEFVINSVVEQDEDDRYFQFSMSAKDDAVLPKPHVINVITDTGTDTEGLPLATGIKIYINFDMEMTDPALLKSDIVINGASVIDEVILSNDAKSFICQMAVDDIRKTDVLSLSINGGIFEADNGELLDTVENFYIQNNSEIV